MNGHRWATVACVLVALVLAPVAIVLIVTMSVLVPAGPDLICVPGPPAGSGTAPAVVQPEGRWNGEQVGNAATIVVVGVELGVPRYGWTIAVATAMQESSLHNLSGGDRDSLGLFQQRPSQGWGTPEQILDPRYAARAFYEHLARVPGWQNMQLTEAAQAVQRSAYPQAYAKWQADAEHLVSVITATAGITCTEDNGGIPAGLTLPSNTQQATAVAFALAQRGKPYVWGAEGPDSYDCSGLTMAAWAKAGVRIPRVAADQAHTGMAVTSLAAMQPGDLIFIPGSDGSPSSPGHVGMYIGRGTNGTQYLIHAPQSGDVVRVAPVSGWRQQIAAIRRPLNP